MFKVKGIVKYIYDASNEVLDNFDFDKVLKVMEFLDWKWQGKIPEKVELIQTARKLLIETMEMLFDKSEEITAISTGGFQAEAWLEDGKPVCSLKFIIEEV